MLETLIAPRIRRTLLEHLVAHPEERFYLRGLAKDLSLPISPLRRELKRLEGFGMLRAVKEGNMLFYTVDTTTPIFQQLHRVTAPVQAPQVGDARAAVMPPSQPAAVALPLYPVTAPASPTPALPMSLFLGASIVGLALLLVVIGLVYVTTMSRRSDGPLSRRSTMNSAAARQPSASGLMRGSRLQILPGGFGGFSASNAESR